MKKHYHLSNPANVDSITKNGIRANKNGEIFLFEDHTLQIGNVSMRVSDSIAYNQVFLEEYYVWEVVIQENTVLMADEVAELTAPYQFILHQPRIAPTNCKLVGKRVVNKKEIDGFKIAYFVSNFQSNRSHPSDQDSASVDTSTLSTTTASEKRGNILHPSIKYVGSIDDYIKSVLAE